MERQAAPRPTWPSKLPSQRWGTIEGPRILTRLCHRLSMLGNIEDGRTLSHTGYVWTVLSIVGKSVDHSYAQTPIGFVKYYVKASVVRKAHFKTKERYSTTTLACCSAIILDSQSILPFHISSAFLASGSTANTARDNL